METTLRGVGARDHFLPEPRGARAHAGADRGASVVSSGTGLTLHVRAHEGSVCVVARGTESAAAGNGHHLAGGDNVRVVDAIAGDEGRVFFYDTAQDVVLAQRSTASRGDEAWAMKCPFPSSAEVADFVGDAVPFSTTR